MVDHGSCRYLLSGFQSFGCLLLEIRWATLAFCLLLGTRQVGYSVILELFSLKKTCLHADESSDTDLLLWFLQRWHFFLHLQFGNRRFAFIRVFIVVSYSTVHITLYQHLFFSIRFLHEHQHQFQQHSTEKTCNTDVCAKRSAHGCKQLPPPWAGDILVTVPPETWPLFPPHTGSCLSTHARCPLSPRGHQSHTTGAQLPGTLEEKQSVLQSLPTLLIPN